ncbi:MAG: hypothetical protein IJP61_02900, partial [Treponema sp.]|nr:hypothetical protein [Treponema sp.]
MKDRNKIVPVILYPDWENLCNALPEKQRARLLSAIFAYMKRNEEPGEDDPLLTVAWAVEKPREFDPRGQATMTPVGKNSLTLCGKIKMTPESDCFSGAFCSFVL